MGKRVGSSILAQLAGIGLVPRAPAKPKFRQIGWVTDEAGQIVTMISNGRRVGIPHMTIADHSRYTGEKLRQLRAERGVGNHKHLRGV